MDRLEPRLMLSAHYYAFTASAETWTAAEQEAVSHGGHLVSITSQAEQDFVTQHFVQNNPSYVFWIGLNDQAQKYTWQWSNGDPVTYTNWNGGLFSSEPNDLHGEDYGSINWHYVHRGDVLGTWNDEPNGGVDGSVDVFSQGNPEPHFGIMEFNAPPTGISNTVVSYDDDSDDRISGATALGDMTQTHGVEGDISDPLDADLYSFSAAAGQNVSFDIDSIVPNDKFGSYMRLFDSSGNILAVDAHAKPGILSLYQHSIENLAYHFNSGGTYYLGVSGLGNNAYDPITGNGDAVGDTGKYSLNVFPGVAGTVYRQGDDTAYSADLQSSGNGPIDPSKDAWIIIHGRNSSRENMAGLEGAVHIALGQMQRDDQVMTLDWSGAAHSAGVGFGGENAIVNVGQWAADALADIGFAGSQIHLIGHSWGSYVADELAQRIPYIKGHAIDFVDTIVALDPATDAPATLPGYNYNPDDGHINFNDHSRYSWAFHTSILGSEYTPTTADEAFVYTNDNINPTISHSQAVDRFAAMIANTGNHVSEYFSLGRLLAGPSGPARPWQPDHYSSDAVPSGMTLYATDGYEARLTADDGGVEPYELRYFDSSHHEITIYASDPDDGSQDTPIVKSIIAATGPGTPAMIYDLDPNGQLIQSFVPFDGFTNGLTIASGDINADGTPDIIVAAGPGGATNIRVFDGKTGEEIAGPLGSFLAYPGVGGSAADPASTFYTGAFQGQINLAAGDINGDGHDDIIVSIAAAGPPHLKVFSGADGSELMSLLVYPGSDNINDPAYFGNSFQGGVRIASGDVTGDGRDDILTAAGPGAGPHVKVYDGVTHAQVKSYYAYDPGYAGGVRVAAGDYNGDGVADIITAAGIGVGPHVKAINASDGTELASFYAYDTGLTSGIWIASTDIDGDGKAEILTMPDAGGTPNVKIFKGGNGTAPAAIENFYAFDSTYTGGGRIAVPSGTSAQGTSGGQSLYVANHFGNAIEEFNSSGIGTQFNVSGDLNKPTALAFDGAGNLYVTNSGDNTIEKFDSNGVGTQFNISGDLSSPYGMAFDNDGNLYVANNSDDTIEKFNSSGVGTRFNTNLSGGYLDAPVALAFDSAGNLYVASPSDDTIYKFNSSGVGTQFNVSGDLDTPVGLAFDNAGNLYVANLGDNTIEKFDSSGVGTTFASGVGLNTPWNLAFDNKGNLYVTNGGTNTIEKFDSSGIGTQFNISGDLDVPWGLAFGPASF